MATEEPKKDWTKGAKGNPGAAAATDPRHTDKGQSSPASAADTPGRPTDSGSRQQTQKDQTLQSTSPRLDKKATRRTKGPAVPTRPPSEK